MEVTRANETTIRAVVVLVGRAIVRLRDGASTEPPARRGPSHYPAARVQGIMARNPVVTGR